MTYTPGQNTRTQENTPCKEILVHLNMTLLQFYSQTCRIGFFAFPAIFWDAGWFSKYPYIKWAWKLGIGKSFSPRCYTFTPFAHGSKIDLWLAVLGIKADFQNWGEADGRVVKVLDSQPRNRGLVPPHTRSSVPKVLGQDLYPKCALRRWL